MKLHINTVEDTEGLIFKKKIWRMDAQLELSEEEAKALKAHPEVGKITIGRGIVGTGMEMDISVEHLINGIKGWRFSTVANQTDFEQSIREGCADLKEHLARLGQMTSGPKTVEF